MHFHSHRMGRLVAGGLLPERAGQPVRVWAHISLADLLKLDGSSALMEEWTAQVRLQWAAHQAAASVGGGDGGAWLDGDAAAAMACDAAMAPIVTGEVNPAALMIWSSCVCSFTSFVTAPAPAATAPAIRARPPLAPPARGKRLSRPSSAKP